MFSIQLAWKEYNVSLEAIETWMKSNAGELYTGNSADAALTLWFTEDPGETITGNISSYWAALTAESSEATSYKSAAQITSQIASLKTGMVSKAWNDLTTTERKLLLDQPVTNAELFA